MAFERPVAFDCRPERSSGFICLGAGVSLCSPCPNRIFRGGGAQYYSPIRVRTTGEKNFVDLDELYALLAIGAVAPDVAEAVIDWMEQSPRSKSTAKFLRSQFTHLPN